MEGVGGNEGEENHPEGFSYLKKQQGHCGNIYMESLFHYVLFSCPWSRN